MIRFNSVAGLVLWPVAFVPSGLAQGPPAIGPSKGWLFLHGGAALDQIQARRFTSYGGSPNVTMALIPTGAYSKMTPEQVAKERRDTAAFFGAAKVIVVQARNRKEANSAKFAEPLREVRAVWI